MRWRSIKTRITLRMLGLVLLGMAALAYDFSSMLREDLQRMLGDQQFSVVSLAAAGIDRDISSRLDMLEAVAAGVTPAMMRDVSKLRAHLQDSHVFPFVFNRGTVAYQTDGTALAEVPLTSARVGAKDAARGDLMSALQGKAAIGKPHLSEGSNFAEFLMSVPILSPDGRVMGVLAGITQLNAPNFLDRYVGQSYGTSGGYVLISREHRLVVTATDRSRLLDSIYSGVVSLCRI